MCRQLLVPSLILSSEIRRRVHLFRTNPSASSTCKLPASPSRRHILACRFGCPTDTAPNYPQHQHQLPHPHPRRRWSKAICMMVSRISCRRPWNSHQPITTLRGTLLRLRWDRLFPRLMRHWLSTILMTHSTTKVEILVGILSTRVGSNVSKRRVDAHCSEGHACLW